MLCLSYDSYFRFIVFSRVLYLNKYVIFNYVSLLKSSFHLNVVLCRVRIKYCSRKFCLVLFLSFILFHFSFSLGPTKAHTSLPKSAGLSSHPAALSFIFTYNRPNLHGFFPPMHARSPQGVVFQPLPPISGLFSPNLCCYGSQAVTC